MQTPLCFSRSTNSFLQSLSYLKHRRGMAHQIEPLPLKVIALTDRKNSPNIARTLSHEFGHALGMLDLGINGEFCREDYPSLMYQTGHSLAVSTPSLHDEYSILDDWGR